MAEGQQVGFQGQRWLFPLCDINVSTEQLWAPPMQLWAPQMRLWAPEMQLLERWKHESKPICAAVMKP